MRAAGDMQFFSYPRVACLASIGTLLACSGQIADNVTEGIYAGILVVFYVVFRIFTSAK